MRHSRRRCPLLRRALRVRHNAIYERDPFKPEPPFEIDDVECVCEAGEKESAP